MNQMNKDRILKLAQRKAGMVGRGKAEVIRVVCDRMGVPMPPTWDLRYALMKQWVSPEQLREEFVALMPPKPQPVKAESKRKRREAERAQSDEFLLSYEWRKLRMVVLKKYGRRCQCCGATPADGIRMHVDHIKPRKTHPELALVESNLQVLCEVCNHGKGNWDETDWRPAMAAQGGV